MDKNKNIFQHNKYVFHNGIISSFCGVASITAANVFDIARVRMLQQSFKENLIIIENQSVQIKQQKCNILSKLSYFKDNTFRMFVSGMKTEGFKKTFFTGYLRSIQLNILRNITFFPSFEYFKNQYQKKRKCNDAKNVLKQTFYATSMTRFVNSFILFPLEVLRIETQLNRNKVYLKNFLKKFYQKKQQYLRSFIRFQISQIFMSNIYFCTYEQTKYQLKQYNCYQKNPNYYLYFHASFITTFLTSFVFFPLEILQVGQVIINKQMQTLQFYQILSKKIGKVGILKGTTNYMLRHFLSMSIFFGLYETYKITYESIQIILLIKIQKIQKK